MLRNCECRLEDWNETMTRSWVKIRGRGVRHKGVLPVVEVHEGGWSWYYNGVLHVEEGLKGCWFWCYNGVLPVVEVLEGGWSRCYNGVLHVEEVLEGVGSDVIMVYCMWKRCWKGLALFSLYENLSSYEIKPKEAVSLWSLPKTVQLFRYPCHWVNRV